MSGTNPAPGWYQQGAVQRYWDGEMWTAHTAPVPGAPPPPPAQPAPVVVVNAGPGRAVHGGLTNGQHAKHAIVTVLTVGMWAPFWWLAAWSARRRTSYR